MRIPKFVIATAAVVAGVGGLVPTTVGAAGASSTAAQSGTKVLLDQLCAERGGLVVNSPYSIARCQGARANRGFDSERLICELGDGMFSVTISTRHMNRASWGCFPTSPPA